MRAAASTARPMPSAPSAWRSRRAHQSRASTEAATSTADRRDQVVGPVEDAGRGLGGEPPGEGGERRAPAARVAEDVVDERLGLRVAGPVELAHRRSSRGSTALVWQPEVQVRGDVLDVD